MTEPLSQDFAHIVARFRGCAFPRHELFELTEIFAAIRMSKSFLEILGS